MKKIVVLFSGEGTNLQNLIDTIHRKDVEIVATITNNPDANGIRRSQDADIETKILNHRDFSDRESYDTALVELIESYEPDLVVLCGFMRILTSVFTSRIRAINLHPSLLPAFKGANAIRESFESGIRECGVSIHWVNEELDGGDIILQKSFNRDLNDSFENFSDKIHALEYEILPLGVLKALKG